MKKVVVIGGGASGMFAALTSAKLNNEVILLEKNEKLGKKIYITGKGRCNLTNDVSAQEFFKNVVTNPKFLFSSIYSFTPTDTINFFTDIGLNLTVERGNRVFPSSNKASDVTKFLEKELRKYGVDIKLNTDVFNVKVVDGVVKSVLTNKGEIFCDSVIIATGGISYPSTGSTGDGYTFAKKTGHKIVEPKPSLVGLELSGNDFISLQGLSLKNVSITTFVNNKEIYSDFGEMLFTHYGVSGPIILSSSCYLNKCNLNDAHLKIDLKPALDDATLDARLIREFAENNNKFVGVAIRSLVPSTLVDTILSKSKLSKNKKCAEVTKEERKKVIYTLKNLDFKVKRLRPVEEAVVTSGGVSVKDINPKTMESKHVKGLYFCGEVIDVDAFTGGFNLQIAFSTGYTAGNNA